MLINNQRHLVQPANDSVSAWFLVYFKSGTLEPPPTVAWPSGETIIAHFLHQLVIDQIACEQVIPIAGEFIPLAMKVRNAGRGHYTQKTPSSLSSPAQTHCPASSSLISRPARRPSFAGAGNPHLNLRRSKCTPTSPADSPPTNSKPIRVNHRGNRSHCKTIECESILSPAKTVTNKPASMDETAATGSSLEFGLLSLR